MEMMAADAAPGFEEKAFFEYHLYTLGRPATIPDNSTKQLELFEPARSVPAEKVLVYDGARMGSLFGGRYTDQGFTGEGNTKVDVFLKFENHKDAGLGVPMPKGRIRVSQVDPADQSLEFIGEDVIDHTPGTRPCSSSSGRRSMSWANAGRRTSRSTADGGRCPRRSRSRSATARPRR